MEKIILVGGSTFIPLVKRTLEEQFDIPVERDIDPMIVVAAGAAIYAGSYSSEITISSAVPHEQALDLRLS